MLPSPALTALTAPTLGDFMLPSPALTALTVPTPARELFLATPAEEDGGIDLEVPKLKEKKLYTPHINADWVLKQGGFPIGFTPLKEETEKYDEEEEKQIK